MEGVVRKLSIGNWLGGNGAVNVNYKLLHIQNKAL